MATFKSGGNLTVILITTLFFVSASAAFAAEELQKIFAMRAQAQFRQTQSSFKADERNVTNAWQFGRACFDFADFAKNDDQRADTANQGITACRAAIVLAPKSVQGHYYLAMNLGQLARTETVGALKLVKEMEREFKTAVDLDENYDFAGPDRSLGLLYRDAPGWPASIGSKRKARDYLERAARLAPGYPENILNLLESYLKWNETRNARTELEILGAHWPDAQKSFTGEAWEKSWNDWNKRRDACRQKLDETLLPTKLSKKQP